MNCYGQTGRRMVQILPPIPEQQREFCAAYQEDTARHNAYAAKLAAALEKAGDNPIAKRAINIVEPDYERLFRAKQAAVMGNGVFRDWVAHVRIELTNGDHVFLSFDLACKWTEYGYRPNSRDAIVDYRVKDFGEYRSYETLSFGTKFLKDHLLRFSMPIPISESRWAPLPKVK